MKRIILAAAVLLIAALFGLWFAQDSLASRDAEWYGDFVCDYGPLLQEIAAGERNAEQSLRTAWILKCGRIESVHRNADRTLFYLHCSLPEGHRLLAYQPDAPYLPQSLSCYDNWRQIENDDAFCSWQGGMGDRAYIHLWNLGDGFFFEEAYLPT